MWIGVRSFEELARTGLERADAKVAQIALERLEELRIEVRHPIVITLASFGRGWLQVVEWYRDKELALPTVYPLLDEAVPGALIRQQDVEEMGRVHALVGDHR